MVVSGAIEDIPHLIDIVDNAYPSDFGAAYRVVFSPPIQNITQNGISRRFCTTSVVTARNIRIARN